MATQPQDYALRTESNPSPHGVQAPYDEEVSVEDLHIKNTNNLSYLFGLGSSEMADAIFVAIHFRNAENIYRLFSIPATERKTPVDVQLGIAMLDTRDIHQDRDLSKATTTKNYSTGCLDHCLGANTKFRFGPSETIAIYDLAWKLRECLSIVDERSGERRKVVLVCRQYGELLRTLQTLGVSNADMPSLMCVLDTHYLSVDILGRPRGAHLRFKDLAAKLSIPLYKADLEGAGNAANCIMRILLLLVVQWKEHGSLSAPMAERIELLRQIGEAEVGEPTMSSGEFQALMASDSVTSAYDPQVPIEMSYFQKGLSYKQRQRLKKERRLALSARTEGLQE